MSHEQLSNHARQVRHSCVRLDRMNSDLLMLLRLGAGDGFGGEPVATCSRRFPGPWMILPALRGMPGCRCGSAARAP